ncbi:MAG: hypothetical protein IJM62_05135, partial [Lachnospiraceae bacterium]|nr:hypothetical protein [Lachnospiraceae bacterium]
RYRVVNTEGDSLEEFTIKAVSGDYEDEAKVFICHRNDPVQVALYYANGEKTAPKISGSTVTLDVFDGSLDGSGDKSAVSEMGRSPKGKYAIVSQEYADGSMSFKSGLMSQLPPDKLPHALSEIEYLIQYRPGEPVHITDYIVEGTGEKVPAYQKAIDIVVVNVVTGETEETICTLYGGKEFSSQMEVWEGTKVVFGDDIPNSEINDAIYGQIKKLWEDEGYEVRRAEGGN